MNREEFFEAVKDQVKGYLPAAYQDASVELVQKLKNNDQLLTGVCIRRVDETVVPNIYLDGYFEAYQNGDLSMETVLQAVSRDRQTYDGKGLAGITEELAHYDSIRGKLQVRLCDPEKNRARLGELVSTVRGDFTAVYYVNLFETEQGKGSVAVTPGLLENWGITKEQLHKDALAAGLSQTPMLCSMDNMMGSLLFGEEPANLLEQKDGGDREEAGMPMYCLTNAGKMNGASLILNEEVMKLVGKVLGDDLYVLPSSVHEVLLVPVSLQAELSELQNMVAEINGSGEVPAEEILSNKVQYFDRSTCVLENAQSRAERLTKEKQVERAEEPKSVLQRLAEKKDECAEAGKSILAGERRTPQLAI